MLRSAEVVHTTVGDIDLAYNTLGEATDPPVVLISGLGAQLIAWDDAFCQQLVDRGLFVIRFDNRDVGLSSHLADRLTSDSAETAGATPTASYTLAQMAADTAGLIDNLGLGSAHVVGISLGGMIAQILAIEHPERVRSLTSIMSTTGNDLVGQPTDAASALFLLPPVSTREGARTAQCSTTAQSARRHIRPRRPSCATERCVPSTARSIRRASHANWQRP